MRIITLNVNGIRAAAKKGLFEWLSTQHADVVCMQEIRAQEDQLSDAIFFMSGYHRTLCCAVKKGISGVAIYAKETPDEVQYGLGLDWADQEGRYVHVRYGNLIVISVYLPSGTTGEVRQTLKYEFMEKFWPYLIEMNKKYQMVICGDWNIAHKQVDIKNWRGNQKHSGFLPQERAWMDKVLGESGFSDAFRVLNSEADQYTWWSNRGQAWAKNVGWRIDYQIISKSLVGRVKTVDIFKTKRFSDHSPLIIDYNL